MTDKGPLYLQRRFHQSSCSFLRRTCCECCQAHVWCHNLRKRVPGLHWASRKLADGSRNIQTTATSGYRSAWEQLYNKPIQMAHVIRHICCHWDETFCDPGLISSYTDEASDKDALRRSDLLNYADVRNRAGTGDSLMIKLIKLCLFASVSHINLEAVKAASTTMPTSLSPSFQTEISTITRLICTHIQHNFLQTGGTWITIRQSQSLP